MVEAIAGAYEVHPSQVGKWKAEALERLPEVLSDGRKGKANQGWQTEARLYQQIGRLTMESNTGRSRVNTNGAVLLAARF